MKTKRIMALLMCLLTVIGLIPGAAFAAQSTVTIESQTNSAFDYLEYYKDGAWKDLNTPRHWIEQTGEVVYCVEHAAGNPHGDTYTAASPSSVFSASTLSGLNSILMYGYPNNRPSGFTDDEARQATANAIRFWLSEQGEAESYSFTNRRTNPDAIRAKSGYEHVLEYADELLAKARARQELPHSIDFSTSTVQLTANGSGFSGQTSVRLTNINSGYTIDTSALPAGANVSGYTGSRSETLTITVPASAAGQSFSISADGKDTRSVDNITAYIPANGSLQKIFLCATTAQVVATASFNVGVPAYGKVQVIKSGENGAALAGVKFGVFSDSACKNKLTELTTGTDGTATSGDIPVGTVFLKELSTVSPYIISTEVKSAAITRRQFENMVLLYGKMFGVAHGETLKQFIENGSVFLIFFFYFGGVYHFHDHREVLFLRRRFVHKVEDKGFKQRRFCTFPERVVALRTFGRGIADEVADQAQNVLIIAQIHKGIVAVTPRCVDKVKHTDVIALLFKKIARVAQDFPFGV